MRTTLGFSVFASPSFDEENPTSYFGSISPERYVDPAHQHVQLHRNSANIVQREIEVAAPAQPVQPSRRSRNKFQHFQDDSDDDEDGGQSRRNRRLANSGSSAAAASALDNEDVMTLMPRSWVPQQTATAPVVQLAAVVHDTSNVSIRSGESVTKNMWLEDDEQQPQAQQSRQHRELCDLGVQTSFSVNDVADSNRPCCDGETQTTTVESCEACSQMTASNMTTSQNCAQCDRVRAALTVRDDCDMAALEAQWRQLSKMFLKLDFACQQVLKKANQRRGEMEQQQQEQQFVLESDIRSGTLKLVPAQKPATPIVTEPPPVTSKPSAIEAMRHRATATSANSSLNSSRASSVVAAPAAATPPPLVHQQQQQQSPLCAAVVSSPAPSHFVALRKCLVKRPVNTTSSTATASNVENAPPMTRN